MEKAEKNFLRFNESQKYHSKFVKITEGPEFMRLRKPVYEFKSADVAVTYRIDAMVQARYDGPHRVTRKLNPIL